MPAKEPEKKLSPIEIYNLSLSPEERQKKYSDLAKKRIEKKKQKEAAIEAAKEEAKAMVPRLLAEKYADEMILDIEGKDFKPSLQTILRLRELVERGLTLAEIRKNYFEAVEQVTWDKITRHIFKDQVVNAEDLSIQILQARNRFLREIEKQISDIEKEVKRYKRQKRDAPAFLMKARMQLIERRFELEIEHSEALKNLGTVGEKAKAANVHFHAHMSRPPKPAEKEVIVVPAAT